MREGTSSQRRGDHVGRRGLIGGPATAYVLPSGEQGLSPIGHCTSPSISIQTKEPTKTASFMTL
jgi:hypothetical protein